VDWAPDVGENSWQEMMFMLMRGESGMGCPACYSWALEVLEQSHMAFIGVRRIDSSQAT
jgi:hypothetical protein